jgi:hypothetical protein
MQNNIALPYFAGLGSLGGLFGIIIVIATIVLHILFAVCIWNDASQRLQKNQPLISAVDYSHRFYLVVGGFATWIGCSSVLLALPLLQIFQERTMTPPNKSPTAVGAGRSAIAVHVASRRWLSFFR